MSEKNQLINLIMRNKYLQQKGNVLGLALEANDLSGPLENYKVTTLLSILRLSNETPSVPHREFYLEGIIRLIYASKTKEDISKYYAEYLKKHNELINNNSKNTR